jgi:hypothetical protein
VAALIVLGGSGGAVLPSLQDHRIKFPTGVDAKDSFAARQTVLVWDALEAMAAPPDAEHDIFRGADHPSAAARGAPGRSTLWLNPQASTRRRHSAAPPQPIADFGLWSSDWWCRKSLRGAKIFGIMPTPELCRVLRGLRRLFLV